MRSGPARISRPIHYRPRRALTLIELMIALAITTITAAVLAILINATAMGTTTQQDGRRGLARLQAIKAQLGDAVGNARCILAAGSNYLVYWTGDQIGAVTPANDAVNLSELRLLEVDPTTKTLSLYSTQWPAGYSNASILAADQTYVADADWYAAAEAAKTSGFFSPTTISTGITAMGVSLDSATATSARLVSLNITYTDGVTTRSAIVGAGLQNPSAPW